MGEISTLFWDVGGVLGTNGWDRPERQTVVEHFGLDVPEFEVRHEVSVEALETDRITLDEYLDATVFYTARSFTRDQFKQQMFALSQPNPESISLARELATAGTLLMATINNEGRELNQCRIERFGLRAIFSVFVSSCFVRRRKPDPGIYRLAMDVVQKAPQECCFIDDREANLEAATRLGIFTIHFRGAADLRRQLTAAAVLPGA